MADSPGYRYYASDADAIGGAAALQRYSTPLPSIDDFQKNLQAIRRDSMYENRTMATPATGSNTAFSVHSEPMSAESMSKVDLWRDGAGTAVTGPGAGANRGTDTGYILPLRAPIPPFYSNGNVSSQSLGLSHGVDERITYQYALRHAILLDRENAQLEARSRSNSSSTQTLGTSSQQDIGHSRNISLPNGGSGGRFTLKTMGQASGTSNTNNRTPTLLNSRAGESSTHEEHFQRIRGNWRNKGWRSSLVEFGDNAARLIKSEIGPSGRFRRKTIEKLPGVGSNHNSHSPPFTDIPTQTQPPAGAFGSARNEHSSGSQKDSARLTHGIVKAVTRQLKSSINVSSVHPFTRECYTEMYTALKVKRFSETLGERGTIDDLIMSFSDISHKKCQESDIFNEADVARTVNSQVSKFVKLLISVLQNKAHTSREAGVALLRLDDYPDIQVSEGRTRQGDNCIEGLSNETIRSATDEQAHGSPVPDKSICTWVKNIFQVPDHDHSIILDQLSKEVTQEKAVNDLYRCLAAVKSDSSFAGVPDDFPTQSSYEYWKQREISSLEQLILTYTLKKNYMSGEGLGSSRVRNNPLETAEGQVGSADLGSAFEYIPTNTTTHYKILVHKAIVHDIINKLETTDQKAVVLPLSQAAEELLKQCAISWRISAPYRVSCHLDSIKDHYIEGRIPATYLFDSFGKVQRIIHLMKPQEWALNQYIYLQNIEKSIEYYALGRAEDVIEELDHQKPEGNVQLVRVFRSLIINDVKNPMVPNAPAINITDRRPDTVSVIESSIRYRYSCLADRCFNSDLQINTCLDGYEQLAELIFNDYEMCRSIFSDSILEDGDRRFDIPGILAEVEISTFYDELQRYINQFGYCMDSSNIEAALNLYPLLGRLKELYGRFSSSKLEGIEDRKLFDEASNLWINQLQNEALGWVQNALAIDRLMESSERVKHTTSAIDLITCFSQQTNTIHRISWPDAKSKAKFVTQFMRVLSYSFEMYAREMDEQFDQCLGLSAKRDSEESIDDGSSGSRKGSFILGSSAYTAASKLNQASPININFDACLRINNIAKVLDGLHGLQDDLGIRDIVEQLGPNNYSMPKIETPNKVLFFIKVVRAEGLEIYRNKYDINFDQNAQPYVKLAVAYQEQDGKTKRSKIGKTRPVPANAMNPRWNQSFCMELSTSNDDAVTPIEVRVCTRNGPKKMGHRESVHARGYFVLSPKEALSIQEATQDITLDLEPRGHLLIRVTIDSEREDMYFYSGRMFRYLEYTMSDMQQRIVEQLSVMIRDYLSQILVNSSRHRTMRFVGGHAGVERSIQFLKTGSTQMLATVKITQESCYDALIPLIEYLKENLRVLFGDLYDDAANGVIVKVWSEILNTIQDILLPPLHGPSKGKAKALTGSDINNVFDSIDFLKWYFKGGTDNDGIPSDRLENRKYHELLIVKDMYFMTTHELMNAYIFEMRTSAAAMRAGGTSPTGSGIQFDDAGGKYKRPLPPIPPRENSNTRRISDVSNSPFPEPAIKARSPWDKRLLNYQNKDNELLETPRANYQSDDSGAESSTDNLPLPMHEIKTPVLPNLSGSTKSLSRSRSVWAHKDAETLKRSKKQNRLVTDKGDIILRILRLRYDKEAAKFVQTQLDLRSKQMRYEMHLAVRKTRRA